MTIDIYDTTTDNIHVLDDGITIADIIYALDWVKRERARQKGKYAKFHKPTGRPVGRPRKTPPAEDSPACE